MTSIEENEFAGIVSFKQNCYSNYSFKLIAKCHKAILIFRLIPLSRIERGFTQFFIKLNPSDLPLNVAELSIEIIGKNIADKFKSLINTLSNKIII